MKANWTVLTTECFEQWLHEQDIEMQLSIVASLRNLAFYGYKLGRPYADTVKGSKYTNMKELRIQYRGIPLRAFFAFDPLRQAIVLCAGDKSNDKRFYEKMIKLADQEFTAYLNKLGEE